MATAVNLRDFTIDERLFAMERAISQGSNKPLFFVHDPSIAKNHHGRQKEYADCIVITVGVDGPSREYTTAHELAHTLRSQQDGSLQLDPQSLEFPGRRDASQIVSMLEHPSVITVVREYGFEPDEIFQDRARAVLSARLYDADFMSGGGNLNDCFDITTLVEFTGVYASRHSQELHDLYLRARPRLIPRADAVSNIVSEYTLALAIGWMRQPLARKLWALSSRTTTLQFAVRLGRVDCKFDLPRWDRNRVVGRRPHRNSRALQGAYVRKAERDE
jgi:hypothetical protein